MKIITIKGDAVLERKRMGAVAQFGYLDGELSNRNIEYIIADDKLRTIQNGECLFVSKRQIKNLIKSMPAELFAEMVEEGTISIEGGKIVSISDEQALKTWLVKKGLSEEVVKSIPEIRLQKVVDDIKVNKFVVVDGKLVDKKQFDEATFAKYEEKIKSFGYDVKLITDRSEDKLKALVEALEIKKAKDEKDKEDLVNAITLMIGEQYREKLVLLDSKKLVETKESVENEYDAKVSALLTRASSNKEMVKELKKLVSVKTIANLEEANKIVAGLSVKKEADENKTTTEQNNKEQVANTEENTN